jgi:LysM repeat protein
MNNQSPLIPQGSLLEQKNKGRTRVKIAVFFVLAVHGIGLLALLMQGCQKDKESGAPPIPTNNPAPAFEPQTNQVAPQTAANVETQPSAPTNTPTPEPTPAPQTNVATPPPFTPAAPGPEATEYVIVKGDSFATLAKKFKVSVKSIVDANPGVQPTKLKVGQKVHIPAAAAGEPGATLGAVGTPAAHDPGAEHIYSVKSGDTLTKIAGEFGVHVKVLRSFNALKTDKIKVGQKIRIPAKPAGASAAPATTVETAPALSPSSSTGAPPTH